MNTLDPSVLVPPRIRTWQSFALLMALLGEVFLAGDWYGFAAVMPLVSRTLTLSPAQAGFAQGAFAITYAVGMVLWSPLGRRMSARSLFAIGLVGSGLGMMLQGQAQDYGTLLALRFLIGFFDAAVWVGTMKLIVGWYPKKHHGATMGALLAAFSLAITLDFAVGVPMSTHYGWQEFFRWLGAATVACGLLGAATLKGGPRDLGHKDFQWDLTSTHAHEPGSTWSVLRSKWVYVGAAAIFGDLFAISAVSTWVVPLYIEVQKMPVPKAAVVGSVMGLSQVAVLLVGGWLADRVTRTALLKVGALLATLTAVGFTAAASMQLAWGEMLALAAFSGIVVLSGGAIFSLVSQAYGETLAPTAIGFAELGGIASSFVAPALMGLIIGATHSFASAFGAFAAVEAAVLVLLLVIAR